MPLTPSFQSSFSRSLSYILKALGGATVSMGATFSLFLTSAQAASFVTTFETFSGDVTLEWSGEDTNDDGFIDIYELSGDMVVGFQGSTWNLGEVSEFDFRNFQYHVTTNSMPLGYRTLIVGVSESNFRFGNIGFLLCESNVRLIDLSCDVGFSALTGVDLPVQYTAEVDKRPGQSWYNPSANWYNPSATVGGGDPEFTISVVARTPEPTLTLGLITLGGLMLGSRKKVKA